MCATEPSENKPIRIRPQTRPSENARSQEIIGSVVRYRARHVRTCSQHSRVDSRGLDTQTSDGKVHTVWAGPVRGSAGEVEIFTTRDKEIAHGDRCDRGRRPMNAETLTLRLFESLVDGDRRSARTIVQSQIEEGVQPESLYVDLLWPTHEMIERLFRSDQLSVMAHNMATRLLRVLVDQSASQLITGTGLPMRRILAMCGPNEQCELGAQMAVDLLEANGMEVCFAGGGVASDEILARVSETRPDVLVFFSSDPTDLPEIRSMIDRLHEIDACPDLQIAVGGGVFSRADGLAEEIGADLWADHPLEMAETLIHDAAHRAPSDQRTVGRTKRYRNAA